MAGDSDTQLAHCAYLGRATVTAQQAHLRFYEFDFDIPADTPVLEVTFEAPEFIQADVDALIGGESDISIFDKHVEIDRYHRGDVQILRAAAVSCRNVSYDIDDYKVRIATLNTQAARHFEEWRSVQNKITDTRKLAIELLRRAEIKASASEAMHHQQQSAIAVLERLIKALEIER